MKALVTIPDHSGPKWWEMAHRPKQPPFAQPFTRCFVFFRPRPIHTHLHADTAGRFMYRITVLVMLGGYDSQLLGNAVPLRSGCLYAYIYICIHIIAIWTGFRFQLGWSLRVGHIHINPTLQPNSLPGFHFGFKWFHLRHAVLDSEIETQQALH